MSQTNKQKRKQVKIACINCRKKHIACDDSRPCLQCTKHGLKDTCRDEPRKRSRKNSIEDGLTSMDDMNRFSVDSVMQQQQGMVQGYPGVGGGEMYNPVMPLSPMNSTFRYNTNQSGVGGIHNGGGQYAPVYMFGPNYFISDHEIQVLLQKHLMLNQQLLNICYQNKEGKEKEKEEKLNDVNSIIEQPSSDLETNNDLGIDKGDTDDLQNEQDMGQGEGKKNMDHVVGMEGEMSKTDMLLGQRIAMPKPILTEVIKFNYEIINLVPLLQGKIKMLEQSLQQEQQRVSQYINMFKKDINE